MKAICVKWGSKYSAEYVNKLRRMIDRHSPHKIDLYCMTDDPTEIDADIKIVPLPADNDYEVWWNKMYMFQQFYDDTHIFFDLDVVIHNSLESLFQHNPTTPTFISSTWKTEDGRDENDTFINSSVVMWKDARYIWDYFERDPNRYMSIYKGIDRFIWNEKLPIDVFAPGIIYSYWKGATAHDRAPEKYRNDYAVCIVNHKPKPHEIKTSWIHQYWI